jgi:hypothetical protein
VPVLNWRHRSAADASGHDPKRRDAQKERVQGATQGANLIFFTVLFWAFIRRHSIFNEGIDTGPGSIRGEVDSRPSDQFRAGHRSGRLLDIEIVTRVPDELECILGPR